MDASTSREYDRETFIRALSQAHLRDEYFESKLQKVISAISRYARLLFDGFTEHHSPIPHTAFYKRFYPQNEGYGDPTSPNPGSLICAIMNELPTLDICSQMSITWQLALAITGTGAWSLEVNGSWNSQENIAKETTDLLISRHAQAKTWMQVPDEVWIRLQVFCEALVSLVIVPMAASYTKKSRDTLRAEKFFHKCCIETCDCASKWRDFEVFESRCLSRDRHRCAVSGYAAKRDCDPDLKCEFVIPLLHYLRKDGSPADDLKRQVWKTLDMLVPGVKTRYRKFIDEYLFQNAMTVERRVWTRFKNMIGSIVPSQHSPKELYWRQLAAKHYVTGKYYAPAVRYAQGHDSSKVAFESHTGQLLPDIRLLQLHGLCGRMLYSSGHSEVVERAVNGWFGRVPGTHKDGTANPEGRTELGFYIELALLFPEKRDRDEE